MVRLAACGVAIVLCMSSTAARAAGTVLVPEQSAAQANPTAPVATGLLMGQVVDVDGTPIPDAIVQTSGRRVMTNRAGRFVFFDLPKGNFSLTAAKAGYLPGAAGRMRAGGPAQPIELADGQRVGNIRITLWRAGSITGTLYDDAGEPLTGAPIWLLMRSYQTGRAKWAELSSATTDDRGVYRLANLSPGDYIPCVLASQSSMPTALIDAFAAARVAGTTTEFQRPYQSPSIGFSARVPTAGIRMGESVLHTVGPYSGGMVPPTPGEDAVIYSFQTTCHPNAIAVSHAQVITLAVGEERVGADIRLKLVPGVTIEGTVVGPAGPVPHVGVRLASDFAPDLSYEMTWEAALTISDARGRFAFLGVPAGNYTLRALKAPLLPQPPPLPRPIPGAPPPPPPSLPPLPTEPTLWANMPLAVGPEGIRDLTIKLQTGMRVSGRIQFDGKAARPEPTAIVDYGVSLEPVDGHAIGYPLDMRVERDGTFTSLEIPPGRYLVRFWNPGTPWTLKAAMLEGRDASVVPVDLQGGVGDITVVLTDTPTEVTGIVRDEKGATDPTAGVVVFAVEREGWSSYGQSPRRLRYVRPNRVGLYRIVGLPPGQYFLAAVDDASSENWQDPRVLEAILRRAERIVLSDAEKKSQDLVTRNDSMRRPRRLVWPMAVAATTLLAASTAATAQTRDFTPQVKSEPSGTGLITGSIVTDEQQPRPVRRVVVTISEAASIIQPRVVTSDEKGRFFFRNLPPGRYSVSARRAPYLTGTYGARRIAGPGSVQTGTTIVLTSGQQLANIDVTMLRGAVITGIVRDTEGQPARGARAGVMFLQRSATTGERTLVNYALTSATTDDRGAVPPLRSASGHVFRVCAAAAGGRNGRGDRRHGRGHRSGDPSPPAGRDAGGGADDRHAGTGGRGGAPADRGVRADLLPGDARSDSGLCHHGGSRGGARERRPAGPDDLHRAHRRDDHRAWRTGEGARHLARDSVRCRSARPDDSRQRRIGSAGALRDVRPRAGHLHDRRADGRTGSEHRAVRADRSVSVRR